MHPSNDYQRKKKTSRKNKPMKDKNAKCKMQRNAVCVGRESDSHISIYPRIRARHGCLREAAYSRATALPHPPHTLRDTYMPSAALCCVCAAFIC